MLPARTAISDVYPNPSNAVARAGFGSFWDEVNQISATPEVALASAGAIDLGGQSSTRVQITGSSPITSLGSNYRGPIFVRFTASLVLYYNATTLITPTAANLQVQAGDTCIITPKATGGTTDGWVISSYQSANSAYGQNIIGNTFSYYQTGGSSTAYYINPTPAIAGYTTGQSFLVKFHTGCGANPTVAISGLGGAPALVKQTYTGGFSNLQSGDIPANHCSEVLLMSSTQALLLTMPPPAPYVPPNGAVNLVGYSSSASWQNLTGSRGPNQFYTNTTGYVIDILLQVGVTLGTSASPGNRGVAQLVVSGGIVTGSVPPNTGTPGNNPTLTNPLRATVLPGQGAYLRASMYTTLTAGPYGGYGTATPYVAGWYELRP